MSGDKPRNDEPRWRVAVAFVVLVALAAVLPTLVTCAALRGER